MKKFLMAIAILAVVTSVANAGVGITWTIGYGAYDHTVSDLTGSTGALLDSYGALWQLIYAGTNNVADPLDSQNLTTGAPGIQDDYVTGDDVVWAQRTLSQSVGGANVTAPEDGTEWDKWMVNQSGFVVYQDLNFDTAGFVFQRVFETPMSGTYPGSYFYQSPLLAFDGKYEGAGAPTLDFPLDNGNGGFKPNQQIPEPATMGLLGLGALVMAIRRRRS